MKISDILHSWAILSLDNITMVTTILIIIVIDQLYTYITGCSITDP